MWPPLAIDSLRACLLQVPGLHPQSQADPATLVHERESKQEKCDLLTIPRYVRKNNVRRGNRYGLSSEQGAYGRSNKSHVR